MAYKNNKQLRKTVKKRGLRKRWYFDATIGKNVPLIGGTGIRMGTNGVKKIVRRELGRQEETKIFTTGDLLNTGLKENTLYTLSPLTITTGTGLNQRIGSQIYLRHIKLRMNITNTTAQPQVQFRVMVVWSDSQYLLDWTTYAGVGLGSSELFYTSNNYTTALINNKLNTKVICDRLFTVNTDVASAVVRRTFSMDCPIYQRITYLGSNNLIKDQQLYVVIIPTTPAGVTGTTSIGSFTAQALVTYKDS